MRWVLAALTLAACGDRAPAPLAGTGHSSSIALAAAGDRLYVVNPDADSISAIDPRRRRLLAEIPLGVPRRDGPAYTPTVMPRALAVSLDGATVYVTGQRSGALHAVDVAAQKARSVPVCSEPVGVVLSADGGAVFVACSQDDAVVRLDTATLAVTGRTAVGGGPWALAWSPSGDRLLVSHLVRPLVTSIDPAAMTVAATWKVPDIAARGERRLAHGEPRALYDLAARPGTSEVWLAHLLLATDTAQPALDFESTVFPALSAFREDGVHRATLSTDVQELPGLDGAFADIVAGPHAIAFTADGAYALVVDTHSEDVLAVDMERGVQAALLRPLPGHMPEGIALAPDDSVAYIDQRNTSDVAVVKLDRSRGALRLAVDGEPIRRLVTDPMPPELRAGQHLFYSANSDQLPITRNHWMSCASCHVEGRTDAVTWKFTQGPRDTPSNAGGMLGTGFLFRTAARNRVQDYHETIAIEQGGRIDPVAHARLLDELAAYVNHAIPAPIPPATDPKLVARGRELFFDATVGCATCHPPPAYTDSGTGNPALDLAGVVLLHDVGTCVTAGHPDVAQPDIAGNPRAACLFDTPSLRGIASSPPYLHDGRAATLLDVLEQTRGRMGNVTHLGRDDKLALVEFLRSL